VVKKISQCFAEGQNWEDTFPLRSHTGEYRWFLSRAVAIYNEQGVITNWFGTNTDITDQLEASERLSYQKGLLEAQHKTSPMGILVVAPDQKILMYNRRFEEIHGIGQVDLVGRHESVLRGLTKHLYANIHVRETTLERIYATRAQNHDKLYFKDGRIIEWFGAPVLGEKGEYFGYAFSYIDVTEQEILLRQKEEFLAVASHELKTPVTSILAYTQLLHRKFAGSEDQVTYGMLSKINQQINRLMILINDLLDVTKIEQGKLNLRVEPFDFTAMVREGVEEVQRTVSSHKIRVKSEGTRMVSGDRDRIGQVITNFLTNAVKYSPNADTVDVLITYRSDAVELSVRDYGLGLSDPDRHKVFERFFRVEGKDRETYSGLGLGLFIASEIIQRHGGQIGVRSEVGEGADFYFILPLE
jgi:PAS domain S-box-containing protein